MADGDKKIYEGPERRGNEVLVLESDRFWLKIMSAVVVAAILGSGALMLQMRADIAVIQSQLASMNVQAQVDSKYKNDLTEKDREITKQQFDLINLSLSGLRDEQKALREDMRSVQLELRNRVVAKKTE